MLKSNKEINLSFVMIVQNEAAIIRNTLENIKDAMEIYGKDESELVIVDGGSTDNTVDICKEYTDNIFYKKFEDDFADQKNYATQCSKGRWVFNIDSDELISNNLLKNLKLLLYNNTLADLIYVPRVNKVKGLTQEHIQRWGWVLDKDGDINWPDLQSRIYKGHKHNIKWVGKVHETIKGFEAYGILSTDKSDGYYLIHNKSIERQEKQNEHYQKLDG